MTGPQIAASTDAELRTRVRETDVFARVASEHKLRLVRALQESGAVTAMTGDGVNDAPALRQADVGVAMGRAGTAVAREAADMVLVDDDFSTIRAAVEEGRRVYDNLIEALIFALPTNAGPATGSGGRRAAPGSPELTSARHFAARVRGRMERRRVGTRAVMTSVTQPMLDTYPQSINLDRKQLAAAIDALIACAQACTACADACLSEDTVADLTTCIRTDLDCADVCAATARVLSRHTGYDANLSRSLLEACATACKTCGDECASHAGMHEHCRICADACRACEQACRDLAATIS